MTDLRKTVKSGNDYFILDDGKLSFWHWLGNFNMEGIPSCYAEWPLSDVPKSVIKTVCTEFKRRGFSCL